MKKFILLITTVFSVMKLYAGNSSEMFYSVVQNNYKHYSEVLNKNYYPTFIQQLARATQVVVVKFSNNATNVCLGLLKQDGNSYYLYSVQDCFIKKGSIIGTKKDITSITLIPIENETQGENHTIITSLNSLELSRINHDEVSPLRNKLLQFQIKNPKKLRESKYIFWTESMIEGKNYILNISQDRPYDALYSAKFNDDSENVFYTPVVHSFNIDNYTVNYDIIQLDMKKVYINGINEEGYKLWKCINKTECDLNDKWSIQEKNIDGFKLFGYKQIGTSLKNYNFINIGAPLIVAVKSSSYFGRSRSVSFFAGINVGPVISTVLYAISDTTITNKKRIGVELYAITPDFYDTFFAENIK